MNIDINKIFLKKNNDNIYQILHDNNILKFWTPPILVPFGLDNDYGKYSIKLELDDKNNSKHTHLKKILIYIEDIIKNKLNINENEFKSIIKNRENKDDLLECKIKTMKNNIITYIEYEDKDNNYLKTIYDLQPKSYVKVLIEIFGIWDYRNEKKEKNKVGLIVYANKIIVLNQ